MDTYPHLILASESILRLLKLIVCDMVGVQAYSPLGSPGSWVKGEILKDPTLVEIADKLNKSPAQVALRWGIQSGHSVLPKSVNEFRIKENFSLFDWCIPSELFSKLSGIHQVRMPRTRAHTYACEIQEISKILCLGLQMSQAEWLFKLD